MLYCFRLSYTWRKYSCGKCPYSAGYVARSNSCRSAATFDVCLCIIVSQQRPCKSVAIEIPRLKHLFSHLTKEHGLASRTDAIKVLLVERTRLATMTSKCLSEISVKYQIFFIEMLVDCTHQGELF
jgi:hypothetical protein